MSSTQDITRLKIWTALKAAGFYLSTQKAGPNYRHTMKVARFGMLSIMPTSFEGDVIPRWRVWNGSNCFAACTSRQLPATLKDVLSHVTNPELKVALLAVLAPNGLPVGTTVYDTATSQRLTLNEGFRNDDPTKKRVLVWSSWLRTVDDVDVHDPRFVALQIP